MTGKHPYTNRQIIDFRKAAGEHVGLDEDDADLILLGLHEAGYTVTFPEPRYYVADMTLAGGESWKVVDRNDSEPATWVAKFNGKGSRRFAQEHADRLNRSPEQAETAASTP